jgi:hypothetical protein
MRGAAHTPEELETLLEDAFLMRDRGALGALFEKVAVLSRGDGLPAAHGREQIVEKLGDMWEREELYLAGPLQVLQARGTALLAGPRATCVVRRSADGAWRYRIALLSSRPQR